MTEEVRSLADRLFRAFNGMGTDEDDVLAVLTIARDKGLTTQVDKHYRETHPDELPLRAELDDELSDDELKAAVTLYDEGMKKAPPPAASAPVVAIPVRGTLTPRTASAPDEIEVELEAPNPEEREYLRKLGIELPVVSAGSADPRKHGDYVDNLMEAVGFGIYLGGYMLFLKGVELPVMVPDSHFDFSSAKMHPVDPGIFHDHDDASKAAQAAPAGAPGAKPYAYYRGAGGAVIAPTLFTPETTPRIIKTALEAQRQLKEYVQEQLSFLAISLLAGMLLRTLVGWIVRGSGGKGTVPKSKIALESEKARDLAKQIKAKGDPVVANMGGAGASHEPQNAININNQIHARKGIPNHVEADASEIGLLLDKGTVDQVVGHHMASGVIKWERAVPGIRHVLKSGGTFRFDYRGNTDEVEIVAKMLKEAGFKDVKIVSGAPLVTATKP